MHQSLKNIQLEKMSTKFISSSASGYIPPYMRTAMAAKLAEPTAQNLRIDDARQFPSLQSKSIAENAATEKAKYWSGMVSFKDTIVNLIEHEKKSEIELKMERERAREGDGWARLPLKFNKERYIEFNEKMLGTYQKRDPLSENETPLVANLDSEVVYNDSSVECFTEEDTDSYLDEMELENQTDSDDMEATN
jgi:hypothetical protein